MQSTIHAYLYPSKTFIQWADKSSDGRDNRHSVHHGSRLSISIHVSRTGNDTAVGVRRRVVRVISIRASHMESDLKRSRNSSIVCGFQSTLPAWGATPSADCSFRRSQFQSTLPAWGATPCIARDRRLCRFQSTLPAWGATPGCFPVSSMYSYFNPRSPRGERPRPCLISSSGRIFQSTLPAWGATPLVGKYPTFSAISIHAPRVGSDTP